MPVSKITSRDFNQDVGKAKRAAAKCPVIIIDRGQPAYVLMSIDEDQELTGERQVFSTYWVISVQLRLNSRFRRWRARRSWLTDKVMPSFDGRVLSFDTDAALYCAQLHVPNPHSDRDSYIASIGYVHDMTVATQNTKDFEGMGVRLVDPWGK